MKRFIFSIPGALSILGIILLVIFGSEFAHSSSTLTESSGSREVMQIVISLVILGAALYIILSKKYDPDVQKWAYGAIGTVVGYWLPTVTS